MYSKAAPQTTILPVILQRPNLEVRANSYVTRILPSDKTGRRATGVRYIDEAGAEVEQPASLVVLSAFQMHNVRLLLMSGIGKPYDPKSGAGVVGKNYAYQMITASLAFFDEEVQINPFIGAGAAGQRAIDEFSSDHFDHAKQRNRGSSADRSCKGPAREGVPSRNCTCRPAFRAGEADGKSLPRSTICTRRRTSTSNT